MAIDGVIRQVVEAAHCGVFAQPGNPAVLAEAIRQLVADKAVSRQMGLAGRDYLEQHFSRSAVAGKLAAIMEGMLRQPGKPPEM